MKQTICHRKNELYHRIQKEKIYQFREDKNVEKGMEINNQIKKDLFKFRILKAMLNIGGSND